MLISPALNLNLFLLNHNFAVHDSLPRKDPPIVQHLQLRLRAGHFLDWGASDTVVRITKPAGLKNHALIVGQGCLCGALLERLIIPVLD